MSEWFTRMRELFRSRATRERADIVRLLEEEVARGREEVTRQRAEIDGLRAENRALINSLLGTAGVPPIDTSVKQPTVMPVRRRSWPQISAAREAEAARRASERSAKSL